MCSFFRIKFTLSLILLVGGLFSTSFSSRALGKDVLANACAKQKTKNANLGACPKQPQALNAQCMSLCSPVNAACAGAAGQCSALAGQDMAEIANGTEAANAANAATSGANAGAMGGAGAAACAGQNSNLARQALANAVPGAMSQCIAAAEACSGPFKGVADDAKKSAEDASKEAARQAGSRG